MADNESLEVPGISISAASDDESDSPEENKQDFEDKSQPQSVETFENHSKHDNGGNDDLSDIENDSGSKDVTTELSKKLSDVEINEKDDSSYKAADIVGDKVLVERDGKFELVDVAEVKAEYFMMKGIDDKLLSQQEGDGMPRANEQIVEGNNEKQKAYRGEEKSVRPKTSPIKGSPNKALKGNRIVSASNTRKHNDEYSYIKSKYGMTAHQLEMKKKREEVIARRKKEEEERAREEMRRKREDAESAFQAWLRAKNEEYLEKRRLQSSAVDNDQNKKEREAKQAYASWLQGKSKQRKQEKEMEKRKIEEEASSYIIRERQACEEAFNRWLRQKRVDEKKKLDAQKPRRKKRRRKVHKDESLPLNSPAIRFTDYYGYSHTVSL